jgi:hypothetical protein
MEHPFAFIPNNTHLKFGFSMILNNIKNKLRIVSFIVLCGVHQIFAQEYASTLSLEHALAGDIPLAIDDSTTAASQPKRSLLPTNISLVEKTVWGENGVMRSLGVVPPLTPEERKYELRIRRTMLSTHQIAGFATIALMGSAVYCGQQVLNGNRQYFRAHKYLVESTIISYSLTGALSILSPPPMIRRDEFSTITVHKALAWVHITGMIVTPIIGGMLRHSLNYNQLAHYHQISGYVTFAALTAAMLTVTL